MFRWIRWCKRYINPLSEYVLSSKTKIILPKKFFPWASDVYMIDLHQQKPTAVWLIPFLIIPSTNVNQQIILILRKTEIIKAKNFINSEGWCLDKYDN